MKNQTDHHNTSDNVKNRLLTAAMEIFAEKGYRDTTVSLICKKARANVAAVNYYFGSKDKLYIEVWKNAFEETIRAYPPDGGLPDDAPPQDKLRALIFAHTHRMLDPESNGIAGSIVIREMVQPSEAIMTVRDQVILPLQQRAARIMKDLLGPQASEKQVILCCMSVMHQCFAFGARRLNSGFPSFFKSIIESPTFIDDLAEHIYQFSIGAIRALRNQLENPPQ